MPTAGTLEDSKISFYEFRDDDIIYKPQVARLLNCSVRTVETKTHEPNGIPHLMIGGRVAYVVGSLRKWVFALEVRPGERRGRGRRAA